MKSPSAMTPEEKEAFHREAEARISTFSYKTPERSGKPKDVEVIKRKGLLKVYVQTIRDGGENNMHYHTNSETMWMVLRGRARFYGIGDAIIGELGPEEGIFLPGGSRYWFEKVGNEDLELLQTVATEGEDLRINVDAHKDWMSDDPFLKVYEPGVKTPA